MEVVYDDVLGYPKNIRIDEHERRSDDEFNIIISKVTKRFQRVTHKFGIEVPTSVEHAYHIDEANGNKLWTEAIEKGDED